MGKTKELFLEQIERLSKRSLYSFDELMEAWDEWGVHGYSTAGLVSPARQESEPHYNSCFTLGGKTRTQEGALIKVPMYIDEAGQLGKLHGGVDGELRRFYGMTYENACGELLKYLQGNRRTAADDSLRVSLYLDNAMYGNLHIFVIDFDKFDTKSEFFKKAEALADKVTRSQGGGYHMFYGVNKQAATPLFDSINLLASRKAKSFVCATRKFTLDGANKVDMFCDARQLMYEWEHWDNSAGLTDKTLELYDLIRHNFALTKAMPPRTVNRVQSLLEQIEELGNLTGYPPNLLLSIWVYEWAEDQKWEAFKQVALELDL